jgi:hypothetical protein
VLTTTFVSPRNGFSVDYPDRGEPMLTPATNLFWSGDDSFDVIETGLSAVFKGASTTMQPSDSSFDEWVDTVLPDGGCEVPHRQWAEITIDGLPGRIVECPGTIMATVVDDAAPQPRSGGRLYLFTLLNDRTDARAVFDAFASTIDLTPETAVDLPGLPKTFVSATNGFSVNYYRGLVPATKLWDPVDEPPFDKGLLRAGDAAAAYGFDLVDTGHSAVFLGASTEVPDGVSLDEWVDATVARYSFCAPRSQQPEISIDGQPGRVAECAADPDTVEIAATVVVDGRLYLFTLLSRRDDTRALFDAFVDTIDLRPEDAAVPSSTPSS